MKRELVRRLRNLALSFDQTGLCILTLGHSDPDHSMSGAAWRAERDEKFFGFMRPLIDTLFWFDPDHCLQSYLKERKP